MHMLTRLKAITTTDYSKFLNQTNAYILCSEKPTVSGRKQLQSIHAFLEQDANFFLLLRPQVINIVNVLSKTVWRM